MTFLQTLQAEISYLVHRDDLTAADKVEALREALEEVRSAIDYVGMN